jgi:hypothetical protein
VIVVDSETTPVAVEPFAHRADAALRPEELGILGFGDPEFAPKVSRSIRGAPLIAIREITTRRRCPVTLSVAVLRDLAMAALAPRLEAVLATRGLVELLDGLLDSAARASLLHV